VHGHDEAMREAVARFIEQLGFEVVILHEQANRGQTLIEKFESHGEAAGFAIVLLSADDEGCAVGGAAAARARQNVVLKLGYFYGKLGRKRVCALKRGDLELPSDFVGVVYEPFDDAGTWKLRFALWFIFRRSRAWDSRCG
jgi:predicted nucleotide-binding protein